MAEPIKVLLVDDHQMVVQAFSTVLGQHEDISVVGTAGSASEARELARKLQPDVILMDNDLPDGTGVGVTAAIKADLPDTQVVMVTSADDDAVLARAIEVGCAGFVTKQRALEEVVRAVRAVAAGEVLITGPMLAKLLPKLHRGYKGIGSDLTKREVEILQLVARGMSNKAIAKELFLSLHTVRNHLQNALTKMGAHSRLEAVAIAVREGLITHG